jgi:SnoaL-like polyketide cyclase
MGKVDTVNAVVDAIEAQEWSKATSYLTEDFTFSGAVPQPISGEQWMGVHRALAAAFSDFNLHFQRAHEESGKVFGEVQLTGDHTGELRLPIPGIPVVPATGKHISLPAEPVIISFRGEKISNYEVEPVPESGIPGILQQIGAASSAH